MISQITIRNFKSLRDITVDLDPLTVLIGRSGSGKSNFVNALRFLREYLEHRNDDFIRQKQLWQTTFCATAPDDVLLFQTRLQINGLSTPLTYHLGLKYDRRALGVALYEEGLRAEDKPIFLQQGGKWLHEPAVVSPP